jgi:hypothetical protein
MVAEVVHMHTTAHVKKEDEDGRNDQRLMMRESWMRVLF